MAEATSLTDISPSLRAHRISTREALPKTLHISACLFATSRILASMVSYQLLTKQDC